MADVKQVFLSSTVKGLKPCRDAVSRAISGLDGYHMIRMEDFGAREIDSDEFCRKKVAECDIFILILGHDYGSCPKGCEQSFTEREYQAAFDAGRKRLVFLPHHDFVIQPDSIEPDEIKAKQERFRERVSVRPTGVFTSVDNLAQQVVQAIYNCEKNLQLGADPSVPRVRWISRQYLSVHSRLESWELVFVTWLFLAVSVLMLGFLLLNGLRGILHESGAFSVSFYVLAMIIFGVSTMTNTVARAVHRHGFLPFLGTQVGVTKDANDHVFVGRLYAMCPQCNRKLQFYRENTLTVLRCTRNPNHQWTFDFTILDDDAEN